MYYDKQPEYQQNNYKTMLEIMGKLSRLFSESATPYLYYRAHENIFAKYFDMENNGRSDDSADSYNSEEGIGIGLKTWVGQDNQKVAEFGKLRPKYENLDGMELIKAIAYYRNERIQFTKRVHGLHTLYYHVVKRIPAAMCIYEAAFDEIDIDSIELLPDIGNANSIYFTDGNHKYHFSKSKCTLYMNFDDMVLLDKFPVAIIDDPYEYLRQLENNNAIDQLQVQTNLQLSLPKHERLCLRLYSTNSKGKKFIPEKSGLNQWNGARKTYKTDPETGERYVAKITPRNPNELYIPYPVEDRLRKDFFPPRDTAFNLRLPNGQWISAKVCQADGKAIMSNPNEDLGKWLLRDVFRLPEGTKLTYDLLQVLGVDSVIFTKLSNGEYSVDFAELDTYETFYDNAENDEKRL